MSDGIWKPYSEVLNQLHVGDEVWSGYERFGGKFVGLVSYADNREVELDQGGTLIRMPQGELLRFVVRRDR